MSAPAVRYAWPERITSNAALSRTPRPSRRGSPFRPQGDEGAAREPGTGSTGSAETGSASFPLRCSDRPHRLGWPSYERCLQQAPESTSGGRKRTHADFTFCCIAIDHFRRTPEETAAKLMEVSGKAQENGEAYALRQAMNAAERVAANPRSRSR